MNKSIEANIIKYDDLLETEIDCFMFSDVEFLVDFGPWKKGERVETLKFNFNESTALECDVEGLPVKGCDLVLSFGNCFSRE